MRMLWVSAPLFPNPLPTGPRFFVGKGKTYNAGRNLMKRAKRAAVIKGPAKTPKGS
jgi:hypothetical protein